MDTTVILETSQRTTAGTIHFPEVVQALLSAGVEYFHVDYIQRRSTFYSAAGEVSVTPIDLEGLPDVAADFDSVGLRANILDSQTKGQTYRDFSVRAMRQGVQGYYAFLRGRRVTYFGRNGDQHIEWFPEAKPERGVA